MADASTSSSNEQSKFSSKRRRQLAKPVAPDLIFNLPANDFMSKIELFSGPQVKVEVEGESFKLPKNLLCHYSSYFRAAFEGQFKEMHTKEISLTGFKADTFRTIVQWMFQGSFNVPKVFYDAANPAHARLYHDLLKQSPYSRCKPTKAEASEIELKATNVFQTEADLFAYVDFLTLANYIDLQGPFHSVLTGIKKITHQPDLLEAKHFHLAMSLYEKHPFRSIVMDFLAEEYMKHLITSQQFKFQAELDARDDLALLVLRKCANCFATKVPDGTIVAGHLSRFSVASPNGTSIWTLASKQKVLKS